MDMSLVSAILAAQAGAVQQQVATAVTKQNLDSEKSAVLTLLDSAQQGLSSIQQVPLSDADRFVIEQLWAEYLYHDRQIDDLNAQIKAFAAKAPAREKEAREVLKTIPYVGPVTIEVVVSELGDVPRFRNAKAARAYSGLVPTVRQSGGKKSQDRNITQEGSGWLRWALVEAAWRLVGPSQKWKPV